MYMHICICHVFKKWKWCHVIYIAGMHTRICVIVTYQRKCASGYKGRCGVHTSINLKEELAWAVANSFSLLIMKCYLKDLEV